MDTEGNLLKVVVHPADVHDRRGAPLLLEKVKGEFPRLTLIWADSAYQGDGLQVWVQQELNCRLEVVKHGLRGNQDVWVAPGQEPPAIPKGFQVLPRRWVVERTIAWICRNRRLARDYEHLPASSECWITMAMARLALRKVA